MRPGNFHALVAVSICGLAALSGCGNGGSLAGPCVPVQGKVTLGGRPLVGGMIQFIPVDGSADRARPEGTIDAQGLYSVKTAGNDGAPVGKYRAVVTPSGDDKKQSAQFNPKYSHWDKSQLVVEVKENAPPGAYDLKLLPGRGR